jgi:hypothetical protein
MADEQALQPPTHFGDADLTPIAEALSVTAFKKGDLSDPTTYPTETLNTASEKLRTTLNLLVVLFARVATDAQVQRMGPVIASMLKTIDAKEKESGMLTGGGSGSETSESTWEKAFGASTGGTKRGGALWPFSPAPSALAAPAPAPAPAPAISNLSPVEAAQIGNLEAQTEVLTAFAQRAQLDLETRKAQVALYKKVYEGAVPMTTLERGIWAGSYAVASEVVLVALLWAGSKGVAGLGMLVLVLLVQMYTSVSQLQTSKILSGLGGLVGTGALSIVSGLSGAVANVVSTTLGMGSVTDTIELPTIDSATGPGAADVMGSTGSVLTPGRGFTPAVRIPPLPSRRPWPIVVETKALVGEMNENLEYLLEDIVPSLTSILPEWVVQAGFATLIFAACFIVWNNYLTVQDEKRVRTRVALGNEVLGNQPQPQLPAPPPMSGLFGLPQSSAATTGQIVPRSGGKKRRTFRKTNARATRQKKILGGPGFIY